MVKNITIFTTNTCAYCVMVKKYLDAKGQGYDVVNLDEQPHRQAEALQLSGALTVPVTVVTKQESGSGSMRLSAAYLC
jgi:glutaredoxin 3